MMTIESIKLQVLKTAGQNPEGFTMHPFTNNNPTKGYVVATRETQDCIGKAGLFKVIKYVLRHKDYCIGGWMNEDGTMQFDASKIYDNVEVAIKDAIENGQRAIYNLHTGRAIMACNYENYMTSMMIVA